MSLRKAYCEVCGEKIERMSDEQLDAEYIRMFKEPVPSEEEICDVCGRCYREIVKEWKRIK